ncbi:MAG TPA: iron ABC transporter permease [Tepidisphaeraceae bacterium]|nr:iron ABC transporter permease [Tepidisphaeraceae bacterium]
MTRLGGRQLVVILLLTFIAWAGVAFVCLLIGSTGSIGWPTSATLPYRLESVFLASLVGAALAVAGVTYQALLGNPLADPYLLGTSSGAALAGYLWTLPAFSGLAGAMAIGQQAMAFLGAITAVAVVLAIAGGRGRLQPATLILIGVIVNAVCGALFLLINAIVKDIATPGGPMAFLIGGLQTNLQSWQIWTSRIAIFLGFTVIMLGAGVLNAGTMNDAEAASLGVPINQLRWGGIIVASLITAAAVAVSGPIGFVGLICPHLGRVIVGHDVRRLLPVATMLGAVMLCLADAASRKISAFGPVGTYLPVGVITSLLGGPFFLVLLLTRRKW